MLKHKVYSLFSFEYFTLNGFVSQDTMKELFDLGVLPIPDDENEAYNVMREYIGNKLQVRRGGWNVVYNFTVGVTTGITDEQRERERDHEHHYEPEPESDRWDDFGLTWDYEPPEEYDEDEDEEDE